MAILSVQPSGSEAEACICKDRLPLTGCVYRHHCPIPPGCMFLGVHFLSEFTHSLFPCEPSAIFMLLDQVFFSLSDIRHR